VINTSHYYRYYCSFCFSWTSWSNQ